MPLVKDRVKQTTTSTGTGSVALSGTVSGFQTFAQAFSSGSVVYYCIADGTNWETGIGTYTAGSPGSLSRDAILASSNSGAAVAWGVGTKDVFVTLPAAAIGVPSVKLVTKPTAYTAVDADVGKAVKFTAAATLTVSQWSNTSDGWSLTVLNRSTGNVSIVPSGSDTIAGGAVFTLRGGQDCTIIRNPSGGYDIANLGLSTLDSQAAWSTVNKSPNITLSNNNLTATGTSSGAASVLGNAAITTGKKYFEVKMGNGGSGGIGVGRITMAINTSLVGDDLDGWAFLNDGRKYHGTGSGTAYGSSFTTNNIIGIAVDKDAGKIWASVNNVWQGGGDPVAGTTPMFSDVTGTVYPAVGNWNGSQAQFNGVFSALQFNYTPPSGFTAIY